MVPRVTGDSLGKGELGDVKNLACIDRWSSEHHLEHAIIDGSVKHAFEASFELFGRQMIHGPSVAHDAAQRENIWPCGVCWPSGLLTLLNLRPLIAKAHGAMKQHRRLCVDGEVAEALELHH